MNEIVHGDSHEILPQLDDNSFDAVIIDPPYNMGMAAWDKPVDIAFFTEQFKRIGKEFYAVFGQMPYLREWDRQAEKHRLHFMEHISWVKRNNFILGARRLYRSHEEILIYKIGKRNNFYKTNGKYEDVKVPGLLYDVISTEGIRRYISMLHLKIKRGHTSKLQYDGRKSHAIFNKLKFPRDYEGGGRETNFTNVWSFLPDNLKKRDGNYGHPTKKPELLQMRLIEMLTPENGSVLDCFSGSGTTAVACQRLNRNYLCIEKERDYYEQSVERLKNDVWQKELDFDVEAVRDHEEQTTQTIHDPQPTFDFTAPQVLPHETLAARSGGG